MRGATVVCGASGALGQAVVEEMTQHFELVVAVGHRRPMAALTRPASGGPSVLPMAADLTDSAAVESLWRNIDAIVRPQSVINLVGGFQGGTVLGTEETTYRSMVEVNLTSAWLSSRAAAARLVQGRGGAVVNVAARSALRGGGGAAAYAVTKAAVVRLTEVLAAELAPDRVRVNAVLPGVIDTPANRGNMVPSAIAEAVEPSAIARVIAFLVGPDGWPISGAAIPVYGWS